MTTTKQGMRILSGTKPLIKDIATLEQARTAVVDKPMPIPFVALVVTASTGHMPTTWMKVGFSSSKPFLKILPGFIFRLLQ
jgi:hypothetical protein